MAAVIVGRRTVLIGAAAIAATGARGTSPEWQDAALVAALDRAAQDDDPAHALASLRGFDAATLSPGRRLDLLTTRSGLTIDAEIHARFGEVTRDRPHATGFTALLLRRKLGDAPPLAEARGWINREINRCTARATALFDGQGIAAGTTGERFARLWRDGRDLYADNDEGRDRLVAGMNATLAGLRRLTVPLVGSVLPWCLDVAARRSGIDAKPGTRTLPLPDREGFYTIDLDSVRRRPRWTLPSVVAHELLPGHMVQMPMEVEAGPHPLRIAYAPGFPEGWGIYAERLAALAGLYADDPLGELGYLHWRLFRLGRAAVDFAIHLDGVSIEAAHARLVGWMGEPAYFAPFDSDIARIAADPMMRAAECLYALALERAAARYREGQRPAFHQRMLRWGRMRTEAIFAA